jgi:hypothetical protein
VHRTRFENNTASSVTCTARYDNCSRADVLFVVPRVDCARCKHCVIRFTAERTPFAGSVDVPVVRAVLRWKNNNKKKKKPPNVT